MLYLICIQQSLSFLNCLLVRKDQSVRYWRISVASQTVGVTLKYIFQSPHLSHLDSSGYDKVYLDPGQVSDHQIRFLISTGAFPLPSFAVSYFNSFFAGSPSRSQSQKLFANTKAEKEIISMHRLISLESSFTVTLNKLK